MVNDNTSQLKAHLQSLHASLSETGVVDEELRALLRQLDGDIHQLLQRRTEEPASVVPDPSLAGRSQALAARFAAEHPRMEPALRELGNILSSMGI
ncbi:MAG: DUF4404 family protein [Gammaproteobacteria bacterium]